MNQVNTSNLSSSGDGEDIFVLTQRGAHFTNMGNLMTSGDNADGTRVSADGIVVRNLGTLTASGDGSLGIVVGDPFGMHYDNVTAINLGTINSSGGVYEDAVTLAFPDGIDAFGNHETVLNYGTINALGDSVAIFTVGIGSRVINHGQINAAVGGMIADQINGDEIGNSLINYGNIHVTADESHGMAFLVGGNVALNYGNIVADGFLSFGIAMEGDGNRGENAGSILATGEQGRGVLLLGEHLSFDNHGTIETTGIDSVGIRFAEENLPGTDGGTFTNFGSVKAAGWAVQGSDSDDHVVNLGVMAGTIDLGAGNDLYVAGHGSSLAGELILGEGNDLVVAQRGFGDLTIADFLVGGSDDVLDVSAYGYSSLDELLAHALQSGSDVVLGLSGHDQVVLEDTALASLSANDFLFGGAGAHAIGGGFGSEFHADAGLGMHPDAAPLAA